MSLTPESCRTRRPFASEPLPFVSMFMSFISRVEGDPRCQTSVLVNFCHCDQNISQEHKAEKVDFGSRLQRIQSTVSQLHGCELEVRQNMAEGLGGIRMLSSRPLGSRGGGGREGER